MKSNSELKENYKVTVHLKVQHNNKILKDGYLSFDFGFGYEISLPQCIEDKLSKLELGESVEFNTEWNNIWSEFLGTDQNIFPSEQLLCKVNLNTLVKPKEVWEMNEDQKCEFSEKMKLRGNAAIKTGDLKKSYRCYKSVIRTLEGSVSVTECRNDACIQLLLAAYLNAALCLLKWDHHLPCIRLCNKALALHSENVKALYRRAKAYMGLKYYKEAEKDFYHCLCIEPDSSLFKKELADCHKELSRSCKKEADLYRKMLSKLGSDIRDDSDEMPWTNMDQWSNELADQMMSLPEELEAFGEKMPELKPVGRKSKFSHKIDDYIDS